MAETPQQEKRYQPGSAPRKLLDAVRTCLIEKGYAACSVKCIAVEAGVNHGLVHHYFGSKDGLFAALVEEMDEEIGQELDQVRSREEVQDFLVQIVFVRARLLNEIYTIARYQPLVRDSFSRFLERRRKQLGDLLGLEGEDRRRLFTAAIQGLAIQSQVDRNLPVFSLVEDLLQAFSQVPVAKGS